MNRADFMKRLKELLADVSPSEREEAIQYYNDYFDDAGAENEQSVIASLGSPEQLARTIRAGLADDGNKGEFTEKGFSGYEPRKNNEILNPNQKDSSGAGSGNSGEAPNGGNAYGYRRAGGGPNPYGYNNDNKNSSYQNSYAGYAGQGNAVEKRGKRKMSGGMVVLLVLLCILAAPVVLGVGSGLLGGVIGILGGLFGIVVGFGITTVVLIIVGICVFVYGIGLIFAAPLGGLCMMGGGMICMAVGLFFLWLVVLICGTLIPAVIRGIVKLFQSIFHRGGASA